MSMRERFERVAAVAARRRALTLGLVLAAAIAGGVLALGLKPSTGIDTFVGKSSSSYRATADDQRHFGSDAVVILIREPLADLVETKDLGTLSYLEACLAGQQVVANSQQFVSAFTPVATGHAKPYGGWRSPCGQLMKHKPVQAVYGPATFLNQAVIAVNKEIATVLVGAQQYVSSQEQAARNLALGRHESQSQAQAAAKAAGTLATQQEQSQLAQMALASGLTGPTSIGDSQFISQVVFDNTRGANQPKARFSYLFPTSRSALIQVRLKSSLNDDQQSQAIAWIRQAVRMRMFRSAYGGTYTVTGAPVVLHDLASQITGSIAALLIAAVLVMAAVLLLVFRSRLKLLPLAVALAAAGITFGLTSLVGASLTMASIAVLPILIGLAVDYAVQFQSRVGETAFEGGPTAEAKPAVVRAAGAGGPTIATAALATAVGFLVLLLSPVPMVRGFGVLLVVGIAIALIVALTGGAAALSLRQGPARRRWGGGRLSVAATNAGAALASSARGAAEILQDGRARLTPRMAWAHRRSKPSRANRGWARGGTRLALPRQVLSNPGRVLAIAAVLAIAGWVLDTQTSVQSDVTKLVPSGMPALKDLHRLEKTTGVSGEIDVTVRSSDVTKLSTVRWMIRYEQGLLAHYGYLETQGCAHATLCPALSLPDLFSTGAGTGSTAPASLDQAGIDSLLAAVPPYFSQAVITRDHKEAVLAFGIRLMPLAKQQRVINYMASRLHPPTGVRAHLAGLPVLAAEANTALSSSARRLLTLLAGLIAVGLVLTAVFRKPARVLTPLAPIALATGWSALILYATRIPLNPMSATLGALVIAISTEFSVLLSERFRQERASGHDPEQALARAYSSTGRAVLVSGITAIAGFGVLIASNITMLRDFGLVTLIDLTVSLVGVLLTLPAVLGLAERGDLKAALRPSWPARPRLRRRARVA